MHMYSVFSHTRTVPFQLFFDSQRFVVMGLEALPGSDKTTLPPSVTGCDVYMRSGDVSDPVASSGFPLFVFSPAEDSLSSH